MQPGSASLLGLLFDRDRQVELVIDRALLAGAAIGLHPCRNTSTLAIAGPDLFGRVIPALGREPKLVALPEDPR